MVFVVSLKTSLMFGSQEAPEDQLTKCVNMVRSITGGAVETGDERAEEERQVERDEAAMDGGDPLLWAVSLWWCTHGEQTGLLWSVR